MKIKAVKVIEVPLVFSEEAQKALSAYYASLIQDHEDVLTEKRKELKEVKEKYLEEKEMK